MDQTPRKDLISLSNGGAHIPPPKSTEVVLDEDSYTEAISEIIKRDYFPSLKTLEAQHGYLDALSTRDPILLRDATRKLAEINTPMRKTPAATPIILRTPRGGEWDTPVSTRTSTSTRITSATPPEKKYDINLSLDAFQAKYTSEDNASYPLIMCGQILNFDS
ncbi:3745_t:CDS:2 [Ambispora leptoticha]|uniref:3745_t:CDS:1 n=1 Tax=Ambispora leptoticha TaxID=144679 RepID=A0A9N8VI03_9GLOM|nr:3745_t:CDS:2 [Ambispora leptoticha]